jgi:hypothetical protein
MTTRTWTADSPEPTPWPVVVDEDGTTWRPVDEDGFGYLTYRQLKIVHYGTYATGGILAGDWEDLWTCLPEGATLREATDEEASTWVETWASEAS